MNIGIGWLESWVCRSNILCIAFMLVLLFGCKGCLYLIYVKDILYKGKSCVSFSQTCHLYFSFTQISWVNISTEHLIYITNKGELPHWKFYLLCLSGCVFGYFRVDHYLVVLNDKAVPLLGYFVGINRHNYQMFNRVITGLDYIFSGMANYCIDESRLLLQLSYGVTFSLKGDLSAFKRQLLKIRLLSQ